MGIYEDRQIHNKTGSRPIKLQGSKSVPHTNRMPYNNAWVTMIVIIWQLIRTRFLAILLVKKWAVKCYAAPFFTFAGNRRVSKV